MEDSRRRLSTVMLTDRGDPWHVTSKAQHTNRVFCSSVHGAASVFAGSRMGVHSYCFLGQGVLSSDMSTVYRASGQWDEPGT